MNRRSFLQGLVAAVAGVLVFRRVAEKQNPEPKPNFNFDRSGEISPRAGTSSLFNIDASSYELWKGTGEPPKVSMKDLLEKWDRALGRDVERMIARDLK